MIADSDYESDVHFHNLQFWQHLQQAVGIPQLFPQQIATILRRIIGPKALWPLRRGNPQAILPDSGVSQLGMTGDDAMKFQVVGANRETGQDVSLIIDAATPSAAEEQARSMNILIERIELVAPAMTAHADPKSTKATQRTSQQRNKVYEFIGGLLAAIGAALVICLAGIDPVRDRTLGRVMAFTGIPAFVVGSAIYAVGRFRQWWTRD